MLPDIYIALPHTLVLWSYVILLLFGLARGYNALSAIAVTLITIDSLWNLNMSSQDMTLHVASDLIFIGLVSVVFLRMKHKLYKAFWLCAGSLLFFGLHAQFDTTSKSESDISESIDLLVQFDNTIALEQWIAKYGKKYRLSYPLFQPMDNSFLLDEYLGLSVKGEEDITETMETLAQLSEIIHIEMNDEVRLSGGLNDPGLKRQWTSEQHKLNDFHKLLADQQSQYGGNESVIAILDTGIDADHEDLVDNYKSTSRRYDTDVKGHGTHCAGIAAAVTGNEIGIASFLPSNSDVKVTSIKVLNNFGMGTQKTIIDGIIKAADTNCDVISLSLGGISSDKKEKAYNEAVKYARAKGSIVVVAAGNSGSDASKYSPANSLGVIAVTATDTLMRKAAFGNDVSNIKMGLGAPGTQIYSTFPEDEYKAFDGSSMSAPFVSGLIGLMKSYDKQLDTEQAFTILKKSADKKNGLYVVNPLAALQLFFTDHLGS